MMIKRIIFMLTAVVLSLSALTAVAKDNQARIVTNINKPVECMFSVQVMNIDGKEVLKPALGFDVDAGTHTFKARAAVDTGRCFSSSRRAQQTSIPALEIDMEAGKSYFVALNASHRDRKEWRLEVWKVE